MFYSDTREERAKTGQRKVCELNPSHRTHRAARKTNESYHKLNVVAICVVPLVGVALVGRGEEANVEREHGRLLFAILCRQRSFVQDN